MRKTTVFNLITGFIRPSVGKVDFDGKNVTGKKSDFLARSGIGRTFQLTPLFTDFTTLENVVASYYLHPVCGFCNFSSIHPNTGTTKPTRGNNPSRSLTWLG